MNFLGKMAHPFVLVVEGFLVGALALVLANPGLLDSHAGFSPQAEATVQSMIR